MSYTDSAKIAAYLGSSLTGDQATQATICAAAINAWIDLECGQSWSSTSPIADERHTVTGDTVYLARRPVVAVTTVKVRQPIVGASYTVLAASSYELVDPASG